MAYDLKQEKVLGSGLNWLAPSDLIEDHEAIELQNVRVDEYGGIRSRQGHSLVAADVSSHTLIKANGTRYGGDGSILRTVGGASIASGYDGNPLGVISWRKFLLVTNRSNPTGFTSPIKVSGTTATRMIPAAPVAAPVVTKNAEKVTVISTFDNSETWTTSGGTLTFDAGDKKAGTHSLKLVTVDPGIYTVLRTTTPNLDSVGGQPGSEDDKHRIFVKVDDFSQVGDVNLVVDVSAAADFSEYYIARIPRKKFKKANGNWLQFEIRRASTAQDVLVADPGSVQLLNSISDQPFIFREEVSFGDLGAAARALISAEALTFERVGNNDTRTWATVTQIGIQIEIFGVNTIHMDEWEVFGSAIGALEGRMVHYYTYVTADSTESNPSPHNNRLKYNRISASVALIASADPQVTGINVYRGGGTLGETYRVNGTTPIANATAAYADITSDEDIFNDGFLLEDDHDDPPAAAIFVGPYFGRVIAANTTANPNRYFWSAVNRLFFPGSGDVAGNWNDVGPANEAIVAITMHPGYLLVYKSNSIWTVVGDPDDSGGQYEFTGLKHGCVGQKAVVTGENGDYFVDFDGVYLLSGRSAQKLSLKIENIFRGQTVTLATGITIPPISASNRSKICIEVISGRLYLSYPESGQSANNVTLVYHIESQRWFRDSRGLTALYNEGNNVLLAGSAGGVLGLETGAADVAAGIAIAYQSKYYDCGSADCEKTFNDFEIEYSSPVALTVTAYLNDGTSFPLGTVPISSTIQKKTLQFNEEDGQKAFNCSIRITGTSTSEIFIKGLWLHYYLEARKGSSFDTDEDNQGIPGVKEYRQIELDIDCSAATELKFLTDLPGNAMSLRDTLAIPITSGRRVVSKMLASRFRGYLSRETIDDSTAQFQLYGIRTEYKIVGDYVIANEIWDSDELSFGTEKVKSARAIQIELENTANVTITIFSDLPGGTLVLRDTLTVAPGGRRIVEVPFTANAEFKGRNFRVKMTATADWALYGAALETRIIGSYISGSTGEIYNSDELTFGTEKVKGMRAIEVEIENTGIVTVQVFSDLPGGMALRDTLTIPAGVRRVVDLPFLANAEYRGHLFRFRLSSPADFILYEIKAETRAIGTYIFGSTGKHYDSGELDWNSERIKWAKEIELDIETAATLTMVAQSDIPDALATRVTKTAASTASARKTVKLRLPATFQGRLHRFFLSTVGTDFVVYAARVQIKYVGEPGATGWSWQEWPLEKTAEGIWAWGSLPVEKTNEGVWGWGKLPVLPTGSNEWRWKEYPVDRAA